MPSPLQRPERIGHRGAPREFTENTLPGFLRAVERGADAVELDVHRTRDGRVVVHHDPELPLRDGTRAPITALSAAEVGACVLPGGGDVPTLAQVMDALGDRATVYVELKGEGVGEGAVAVARGHGRRYAFHSFDHAAVLALRSGHPDLDYGVLLDVGTPDAAALMARVPVRDVWPHWSLVNQALVDAAREARKRVMVWTVNDPAEAARLTLLGVDGLCTDDLRLLGPAPFVSDGGGRIP
ncbi:MAG: glycerophosphodiester phosphodiesterase [Gemmatimonadaceae bacterium]|nr:glycerophosphodiester phosphodiesterase [Gemmatimonadaceae bacterium]